MFDMSASESGAPGTVGHVTAFDYTSVEMGKDHDGFCNGFAKDIKGL